jgi:hypothetical protein
MDVRGPTRLPDEGSTKVELTRLAGWRIVLLRGDLTPAFLVRPSSTKVE